MNQQATNLVRRYAEEVWNQHRLDVIEELFAPEHVYHDPVLGELAGLEGVRRKCSTYLDAFPDGNVTCDAILAEGELVALVWGYVATHTGEMLGIAPTGRRARAQGVHLCRIRDGRIVESTVMWNSLNFLQQLGLVKVLSPVTSGSPTES
jgi:steroid delta-isomerase-like uncharacterized protein